MSEATTLPPSRARRGRRPTRRPSEGQPRRDVTEVLAPMAEHYVREVLAWDPATAGVVADAAVRRAVRTMPRHVDRDRLTEHVRLAARHEAWRRQPGHVARTRVVAVAALLLVVVAFAGIVLAVAGGDAPPEAATPVPLVATQDDTEVIALRGRVVMSGAASTGVDDVAVRVAVDGVVLTTVRTGSDGRFVIPDVPVGRSVVSLPGLVTYRLQGASDGRSTVVDVADVGPDGLTLPIERP